MVYITNNNKNDGKHFKNNFEQTQNEQNYNLFFILSLKLGRLMS